MAMLANFKSKAELTRHVKGMIANGDLDAPLITELLRFHPNVRSEDFEVFIRTNPTFKQKEIAIKYQTGEVHNPSYKTCVALAFDNSEAAMSRIHTAKVFRAARNAIHDKSRQTYMRMHRKCEICQSSGNLEADHFINSFHKLFKWWLEEESLEFANIIVKDSQFVDNAICVAWVDFHEEHVRWKALCVPCHQKVTSGARN